MGIALPTQGFMNLSGDVFEGFNNRNKGSSSTKGSSSGGSGNNKGNSNNNNNSSGGGSSNNDNNNNKVRFGSNVDNHLKNVEVINGKKITGGHNFKNLKETLNDMHPNITADDCILDIKPHPIIEGIYEIKLQLPERISGGAIKEPIVLKEIKNPKTVYDPSKISDEQMAIWGRRAMEQGIKDGNIQGERVSGVASNGLTFDGYLR